MYIQASLPLEVNRTLNLCLDLSETKPCIYTTGRVIWSDQGGELGSVSRKWQTRLVAS